MSNNRTCFVCRMTLMFDSLDRYDPKETRNYIFRTLKTSKVCFCHTKNKVSTSVKSVLLIISKCFGINFAFWSGIKTENSPLAHVLHCKIWLRFRKMFSIISTDRYDPKETWKQKCWVLRSNKHFSRSTYIHASRLSKSNRIRVSKWSESPLFLSGMRGCQD